MTNAFWREALDHIPGLYLIFRVDENENAHLIFANSRIREVLGYKPEEFVLASETNGSKVQAEVAALVDRIAELSRAGTGPELPVTCFHSKRAEEKVFHFEFRIFTVKSGPQPFIAVSLLPATGEAAARETDGEISDSRENGFVAESSLMQALMRKVDSLADQQVHLLFRGERSTGKRTLARQVLQAEVLAGAHTVEWDLEALPVTDQNKVVDRLCGEGASREEAMAQDAVVLLIIEIGMLTAVNQQKLLAWLQDRQENSTRTRILATTSLLLEERMQQGDFSTDLYYFLSFDTVLLPPLAQRKDDIKVLVERWVEEAGRFLKLDRLSVSDDAIEQLVQHPWPGNFHEFHEVMRRSLLNASRGDFLPVFDEEAAASGQEDPEGAPLPSGKPASTKGMDQNTAIPGGELMPFDEMSRRYLRKVLEQTGGKIYGEDGAARLLGMKPTTLQSKLKKLGIR
ncbi:MAG: sigma 54-interacting transcriptional regulator [Cyclonatronaceae bacterium]